MSNFNLYQLTKEIHKLLPKINQKYGLEIQAELLQDKEGCQAFSEICGKKENGRFICEYCQRWGGQQREIPKPLNEINPQIRQILVGLKDVLGDNPKYEMLQKAIKENQLLCNNHITGQVVVADIFLLNGHLPTPKTQAENLCQKWLDGLEPLFDKKPEIVLWELLEILNSLLK